MLMIQILWWELWCARYQVTKLLLLTETEFSTVNENNSDHANENFDKTEILAECFFLSIFDDVCRITRIILLRIQMLN